MDETQAGSHIDRGLTRALAFLTTLGFLALIAAGVAAAWLQARNEENAERVEHTLDVVSRINEFAMLNERAETGRRGYLLTPEASFRQVFEEAATPMPSAVDELADLTRDNPRQQQRTVRLRQVVTELQQMQRESIAAVDSGGRVAAVTFEDDAGVTLTRAVREIALEMRLEEQDLLRQRAAEQSDTLRVFYWVLAGAGALLIGVAATTIVLMLRYTRALTASRGELARLNDDLEGLVETRTADLNRANQEIQRFAYIVSHDLRSPLVNVMGFTAELDAARKTTSGFLDRLRSGHPELVERDVALAVDEDLPEAIGFIRTSTQKMDRLINAILRLSREGRRTLTPEKLEMTAVVQGIADTLHTRAADAGAEIVVEPLPPIVNDRVAIEQILSNLMENAVKYLSPGRPGFVRVTGHAARDRVVYEVTDNGRGIDPKDHDRVFDLFRRSGAQDQPGEGIGLAHVRALAYRLGGIVDVKSELDHGATFRLSLPATFKAGDVSDE